MKTRPQGESFRPDAAFQGIISSERLKSWRRPKCKAFIGIPWVRRKKLFLKGTLGQMVFADDVETKAKGGGVAQREGSLFQESRSCRDVSTKRPTDGSNTFEDQSSHLLLSIKINN